ncbi:MAG: hypothetical protein KDD35_03635 [Bdellovibrionales bacterium]|nr:hypothetical protein [Bdellovibrionales bacterium]
MRDFCGKISAFLFFLTAIIFFLSEDIAFGQSCFKPDSNEKHIYQNDFHWNMERTEILRVFDSIYQSEKRLKGRAYFDESIGKIVLPLAHMGKAEVVRIDDKIIHHIRQHIEKALKMKFAEVIIFPDMGHSHFLIPNTFFEQEIAPISSDETNLAYEKMLHFPLTKFVYHTAEQLKLRDSDRLLLLDRHLQWRFYTRNLVGDNSDMSQLEIFNALDTPGNTMNERHAPGYRWWGAGFNISASSKGCFPYEFQGKTYYFDISLEDLPMIEKSTL